MTTHQISVLSPGELDLTVRYLKQHYCLSERQSGLAVMFLKKRSFLQYVGDVVLCFFLGGAPVSPEFPISEAVRNIPSGTDRIEIRLTEQ